MNEARDSFQILSNIRGARILLKMGAFGHDKFRRILKPSKHSRSALLNNNTLYTSI